MKNHNRVNKLSKNPGFKLNWKPSPFDPRDIISNRHLKVAGEPLPSEFVLPIKLNVYDQGNLGSCHDDQTEVLTSKGWKLFNDCTIHDELASVNPEDGNLIYENPLRIIKIPYQGKLICGKHKNVDFKVTPEHKMLVRKWNESLRTLDTEFQLVEAKDLGWYFGLKCSVDYKGVDVKNYFTLKGVPHKHKPQREDRQIPMDLFLQFLGIYLAEGTMLNTVHSGYKFQIAASKEREKNYVRLLLTQLDIHFLELKDRFTFQSKQWYVAFENLGLKGVKSFNKFVPEFVFNCSKEQIKNVLLGHFMGDGSEQFDVKSHYTSSSKLADDIQRLIFLSGEWGYKASREPRSSVMKDGKIVNGIHPEHRVSQWTKTTLSIDKKEHLFEEDYDGIVYCAEVPTYHTLVTRRNGRILISGNCTANAGCLCYKYEALQLGKTVEPSRLFLYYNTREIEGTVNEDSGAYIRDVFKALNKKGLCEEKYFPYIESTFKNRPSQEAYNNGLNYQTVRYTSVPKNLTQIKQTIYSGAAVEFGFLVYSSFFDNWSSTTGDMPIPKKGERVEGGHAVTICGYSDAKQAFYILNSWGIGWGKNGYFWMPYSFLLSDNASDFWCIDEIRIEDQPNPPSPPNPQPTGFKQGLKNVLTKPELIKMNEGLIVKIGKELGLDTSTVYSKPKNIELVWNHLTS